MWVIIDHPEVGSAVVDEESVEHHAKVGWVAREGEDSRSDDFGTVSIRLQQEHRDWVNAGENPETAPWKREAIAESPEVSTEQPTESRTTKARAQKQETAQ